MSGGSYSELPNLQVRAADGIDYAYRDTGSANSARAPLVLVQRFRGDLDNWDPALTGALASRHIIAFDNAGVGGWTGSTPNTIEEKARADVVAFLDASA